MKAFFSKPITWLLTFFNVGIYNLSDGIDSLILKLNFIGLNDHANTIITLSQSIEYQQGIIIMLDTLKCLFMLISLVFFFMTNQELICKSFKWLYHKFKHFYYYLKQLFKPKS
ncbi:hypothetical protein [Aureispira sp. CCB-QB1]|uniref:hypothetical protein n=1 Tax=Aureispira sp. CCB-QB1 TaxID=1313421 RepID=UPI000696E235|nr:hypothetical protein [Aureispira sp. CCB-QB1]